MPRQISFAIKTKWTFLCFPWEVVIQNDITTTVEKAKYGINENRLNTKTIGMKLEGLPTTSRVLLRWRAKVASDCRSLRTSSLATGNLCITMMWCDNPGVERREDLAQPYKRIKDLRREGEFFLWCILGRVLESGHHKAFSMDGLFDKGGELLEYQTLILWWLIPFDKFSLSRKDTCDIWS